jgi:hypothetical protein
LISFLTSIRPIPLQLRTPANLSRRYCRLKVGNKEYGQDANYEVDILPTALIKYGAIDAMMSRMVAWELLRLTASTNLTIQVPPASVRVGMAVYVMWYGKKRASGIVITIGNDRGRGEACKWGEHLVGSGKVLARVVNVLDPEFKPKFLFVNRSDPDDDWPKGSTLATIRAKVGQVFTLMLSKSQLAISN